MRNVLSLVIGTAGHIDHGKSALVEALTGVDPDRLKEEQARGITIDLGFAHTRIGDANVAFVDVPGHERFVRNMLAGAGGLDAVLLVVAADESVKPQTREHFEICRLLGITRGVIALSKTDLVDEDTLALVSLEVRELVRGSFLEAAPIVAVSARTGTGLDDLRRVLGSLEADGLGRRPALVRLPVDRVFTVKGFGVVVTGTLVSGRVAEGDELMALPEGLRARVRGVQVHGRQVPAAGAPNRVALNLTGVEVGALARGVTLASPGSLAVTRRFDARVELLLSARPLRHGARVRVHQGTGAATGRVVIAAFAQGSGPWVAARPGQPDVMIPPGGRAFVRIRLDAPMAVTRLDRFVLRTHSPSVTIGGGVVVDPEPPLSGLRRPASLERFSSLDAGVASAAGVWMHDAGLRGIDVESLVRRGGLDHEAARAELDRLVAAGAAAPLGPVWCDASVLASTEARLLAALADDHRARPSGSGLPRESLRAQVSADAPPAIFAALVDGLIRRGAVKGTDRLALATHEPAARSGDARAAGAVESLVRQAGLTPPDRTTLAAAAGIPESLFERVAHDLVSAERLVRVGPLLFHPDVLAQLKADVAGLKAGATSVTHVDVATFKHRFGLSRKFAIPLLEWLDRQHVTRRVGEGRVIL